MKGTDSLKITSMGLLAALAIASTPVWAQRGPGFGGPSILSRGQQPLGRGGARPITLTGHLAVGAHYSDGLTLFLDDPNTPVQDYSTYGGHVNAAIAASRSGRRSNTTVAYHGGYNVYSVNNQRNGYFQSLSFNHSIQVNRRLSVFAGLHAGTRNSILGSHGSGAFYQDFFANPYDSTAEVFDTRSWNLAGAVGTRYQISGRTGFSTRVGGHTIVRSRSLIGSRSIQAAGELDHQLNRSTSVGIDFSFNHLYSTQRFGETYAYSLHGLLSRSFWRSWRLTVVAGAFRAESERLRAVPVDPVIARIVGQTTTIEAFHGIFTGLSLNATLTAAFRKSTVSLYYRRGINPGNGLILHSNREDAGLAYSYTGLRDWSFSAQATYFRHRALLQTYAPLGHFESYGASASIGRRLFENMHAYIRGDIRRTELQGTSYNRDRYNVAIGMAWSPGSLPLILW